jgi:hypothetical protein
MAISFWRSEQNRPDLEIAFEQNCPALIKVPPLAPPNPRAPHDSQRAGRSLARLFLRRLQVPLPATAEID